MDDVGVVAYGAWLDQRWGFRGYGGDFSQLIAPDDIYKKIPVGSA